MVALLHEYIDQIANPDFRKIGRHSTQSNISRICRNQHPAPLNVYCQDQSLDAVTGCRLGVVWDGRYRRVSIDPSDPNALVTDGWSSHGA